MPQHLASIALALALAGCGARASLPGGAGDAPGAGVPADPCPFAVQEGAPRPMAGSCSTRDGRARVAAPHAPSVTWMLPPIALSSQSGSAFATDALGYAYLLSAPPGSASYLLRRIDIGSGAVDWTEPLQNAGDTTMPTPLVLASGEVEAIGQQPSAAVRFAPESGAATATVLGVDVGYFTPDPPVGADGSLYLVSEPTVGGEAHVHAFAADGMERWTSPDLATWAPPSTTVFPMAIALEPDGTVVVTAHLLENDPYALQTLVLGLDGATGALRFSTILDGQPEVGVVVGLDGSISLFVDTLGSVASEVVTLGPGGDKRWSLAFPNLGRVGAVAADGTLVVSIGPGGPQAGLAAVSKAGALLWQSPVAGTILALSSDGVILVRADALGALMGVDLSTGATVWTLAAPGVGGVCDAALTAGSGIVGLACDGTIFGAGDP